MTRTWSHHRSRRAGSGAGRRAVLRTELFRELFLPPAEEIADPSWTSRLDLPAPLSLWPPAVSEPERIRRARAQAARFPVITPQQAQLRCLTLEMLDYMERELCGPGEEAVLDHWWAAVRAYRRVLALPVMATPKARTLLRKIIDAPWPDVENAAASIERKWKPQRPEREPETVVKSLYLRKRSTPC